MKKIRAYCLIFSFFVSIALSQPIRVSGAGATIDISPKSGSYGKPFKVSIVVDGKGNIFNAAQATVTLSKNLSVDNLILGDCNFSFLKTPTHSNPSFSGGILGSSLKKCTVYTMTLRPVAKGDSSVELLKGSIKHFGDGKEILSSVSKGSYKLTAALKPNAVLGSTDNNPSQYALYIIVVSKEKPVTDASVILSSSTQKDKWQSVTNKDGVAHFLNLKAGIYDTIIMKNNKKVGESILSINGSEHVLRLGINLDTQKDNPLMKSRSFLSGLAANPLILVGATIGGLIAGIGITIAIIKIRNKRRG